MMFLAPAKLNLGLRILGRRTDGYHLLESLFWPISFADEVSIEVSSRSSVSCTWAEDAPFSDTVLLQNEENLVGKFLAGGLGWMPSKHYHVHIKKKIPIGSGLGGVSSNVGTVLRHLCQNQEISEEQAENFSLRLGADVPFFLNPVPSWVTGIGEIRRPISFNQEIEKRLYFLLVLFPFPVSTPLLFQQYREGNLPFSSSATLDVNKTWDFRDLNECLKHARNDLEPLVASQVAPISKALKLLHLTQPLNSGMSGTGSTCFAVYENQEKRAEAAKELQKFYRDLPCKSVFAETF